MSQSYTYTPNPIPSNSPFSVTFNDNTGSIDGLSTYNLETTDSTILGTISNSPKDIALDLYGAYALACDSSGNLYCILGSTIISILKITPQATTTLFVSGLSNPGYLAFDSSGILYCSSGTNSPGYIYKITPEGSVSIFVSGIAAKGLAFDSSGNLYCITGTNIISKITPDGNISVFISSGLSSPQYLAFDSSGNLYCGNAPNTVDKITPQGSITRFANSFGGFTSRTFGLVFDSSGNLYRYSTGSPNSISKITPGGTVTNFSPGSGVLSAGLAINSSGILYYAILTSNRINQMTTGGVISIFAYGLLASKGLALDSSGNLYCANNGNNTICKITPGGETLNNFVSGLSVAPYGLACDSSGNFYCSNQSNNSISKITPGGSVSTFVSGLSVPPYGLAFDSSGNLYCANQSNNSISQITPGGVVSEFASGLSGPYSLVFDSAGNLYFSSQFNNTISKITPQLDISLFVGLSYIPYGLAIDSVGNLYCAIRSSNIIIKITADSNISTFASITTPDFLICNSSSGKLYCSTAVSGSESDIFIYETNQLTFTNIQSTNLATGVNTLNILYDSTQLNSSPILVTLSSGDTPCFKSGTKILTIRGYQPIESLRKGDMIETYNHGFVPIVMIGYSTIYNSGDSKRIKHRLYKCTNNAYSELTEDLIITGCHSILVNNFTSEEQKEKTMEIWNGEILITDYKYRLPACVDIRAKPYEVEGTFTIYHLALSHEDYYSNYGIYANGLLVETTSKRYLKELSNMKLIE
jgi:streptogramin lyase